MPMCSRTIVPFSLVGVLVLFPAIRAAAQPSSGCIIPTEEIISDGTTSDSIPALTTPEVVSASEGDTFLEPDYLVLGVVVNGEARAYPHNVLRWHESINDFVGGKPLLVTFCPLTGSGLVFDPVIKGERQIFGNSGFLHDNNNVMFDAATSSLWTQMFLGAICGELAGVEFELLPVIQSTWEAWKALHPDTGVVSFNTGFLRQYQRNPFQGYIQIDNTQILFPHSFVDPRRPIKERVLGIENGGTARAYPYTSIGRRSAINDVVNGLPVLVVWDDHAQMAIPFDRRVVDSTGATRILSFDVLDSSEFPFRLVDRETDTVWNLSAEAIDGPLAGAQLDQVPAYTSFWFAWAAFNRGTEIFNIEDGSAN